jgi:hypothetical protein
VDNTSLAHSTRIIRVDQPLCEEISKLTGIEYRVLSSAFAGEEKNLALDMVKTAVVENPQGTSEEWQRHVLPGPKRTARESTAPATGTATSLPTSTTTTCGASGGFRVALLF